MKSAEIRQAFLDFFASKQHHVVSSSSLVPINDPTLLFINAGMVQFKDVFLGSDQRDYNRATTVQRCVRAGGKHNDLENVGYTARHHTFFEMMGNFSFGDYFKREAMTFAWDFLTKELKLPEEKLWVTVYEDDQESEDIWLKKMGISPERFSRCGAKDNFWSMGDTGPCGPCTEIFYDHGADIPGGPPGSPDEDGDRYIEIWNLVFMQFNRSADGTMTDLPKPSVDTGMGLERLAAILQGVHSNYEIDLFQALMKAIAKEINVADHEQTSIRVIADHIRSCAFMAVDGVVPSNEGRGYVMRRIVRRAVRHAYKLGFKGEFFYKIVDTLVDEMGAAYPELTKAQDHVKKVLQKEEQRFSETVEQGMKILQEHLASMQGDTIAGDMVFKLYDTYGFPFDLTADIAREKGLKLDEAGYDAAMTKQQEMARAASGFKAEDKQNLAVIGTSDFLGYDDLTVDGKVTQLFVDGDAVDEIKADQEAMLVLDQTPFYAESGGQTADDGLLVLGNSHFVISDVQKVKDSIVHIGKLEGGTVKIGDTLTAVVDAPTRDKIAANHSATHLLHAALRQVLGEHVQQKGSMVTKDRLRFDFSHDAPVTTEQLQQIEDLANEQVRDAVAVETNIMPLEEAKDSGAMALFGEKYADDVRVLRMGDFSVELCGGTHVNSTSDINVIKVTGETGIASGVRRIEAVSGAGALAYLETAQYALQNIATRLKGNTNNVEEKVSALMVQNKQLEKQLKEAQQQLAKHQGADLVSKADSINDTQVLVEVLMNTDAKGLRDTMDDLKSKMPQAVILLAGVHDDKIALVSAVSKNMTGVIKAGDIMKDIASRVDGKGGGRPDMAQGGGTNVAALPDAIAAVKQTIIESVGG